MSNKVEIFIIGKRVGRWKLILLFSCAICIGIIIGVIAKSLIVLIFSYIIFSTLLILFTRLYYWIVTFDGLYIPSNIGLIKYILTIYQYIFIGDEKNKLVFIEYRKISYIDLILESDYLEIMICEKNNIYMTMKISKTEFNQDLVNAIYYIEKKGVKIKNINVLELIDNRNFLIR